MKTIDKEKKRQSIIEICEKYNISAYEIGKNTDLNVSGIDRILKNEIKNPQNHTINTIYDYLNERIFNKNNSNKVEEKPAEYHVNSKIEELKKEIVLKDKVISLLEENIKLYRTPHIDKLK